MRRRIASKKLLVKGRVSSTVRPVRALSGGHSSSFWNNIQRRGGSGRVCVIRKVGGIGDLVMITPSLIQLRKDFPNLHITYAIDMHTTANNVYYEQMKNAWFVNELVDARYVNHSAYDEIIDISSVCIRYEREDLPPTNRIDLFARSMGIRRLESKRVWYEVEAEEMERARQKVAKYLDAGYKLIALHTASMESKRCWPAQKYIDLVNTAKVTMPKVLFLVFDYNRVYSNWFGHMNVLDCSNLALRDMAALIANCHGFVGPDSGPMHIAGALRVPSAVLFGAVPPEARISYYPSHTPIVAQGLSCLGCWYKACPIGVKCMDSIDVSAVMKYIGGI